MLLINNNNIYYINFIVTKDKMINRDIDQMYICNYYNVTNSTEQISNLLILSINCGVIGYLIYILLKTYDWSKINVNNKPYSIYCITSS